MPLCRCCNFLRTLLAVVICWSCCVTFSSFSFFPKIRLKIFLFFGFSVLTVVAVRCIAAFSFWAISSICSSNRLSVRVRSPSTLPKLNACRFFSAKMVLAASIRCTCVESSHSSRILSSSFCAARHFCSYSRQSSLSEVYTQCSDRARSNTASNVWLVCRHIMLIFFSFIPAC